MEMECGLLIGRLIASLEAAQIVLDRLALHMSWLTSTAVSEGSIVGTLRNVFHSFIR